MPTAFISHSSEDRAFIESEILPRLKARGIDVWFSPHSIQTADNWERAIKAGLESSDVLVVMMSPPAMASEWVRAELHWAFTERPGRVVPVMLAPCKASEGHLRLPLLHHVEFRANADEAVDMIATQVTRACSAKAVGDGQAAVMSADEERAAERSSPLLELALACLKTQDYPQAIAHSTSALEISKHAGAYYLRGLGYFGAKDWSRAIDDFSVAIERGPMPALTPLVFAKRARARAEKHDDLRAILDCDHALKLDPSNFEALATRGSLRRRTLQPEKAVEDFSAVVRLNPKSIEGYSQRAEAYREMGDFDFAVADFKTLLALSPAARVPWHMRTVTADSRAIESALNTLRIAGRVKDIERLPPAAQAQLLAGLMKIGFSRAIGDVEFVIQKVPNTEPEHLLALRVIGPLRDAWKQ